MAKSLQPEIEIDRFIGSIATATKPEIQAFLDYCTEQSKDFRLQAMYRAIYKTLIPIFKSKLGEY